ncbi:MAG: hypothetical protein LBR44_08975 [Clostridiales Family XIII bacterium]|nr:hypothetical protein [Clostridiales Family XIII bacterium]
MRRNFRGIAAVVLVFLMALLTACSGIDKDTVKDTANAVKDEAVDVAKGAAEDAKDIAGMVAEDVVDFSKEEAQKVLVELQNKANEDGANVVTKLGAGWAGDVEEMIASGEGPDFSKYEDIVAKFKDAVSGEGFNGAYLVINPIGDGKNPVDFTKDDEGIDLGLVTIAADTSDNPLPYGSEYEAGTELKNALETVFLKGTTVTVVAIVASVYGMMLAGEELLQITAVPIWVGDVIIGFALLYGVASFMTVASIGYSAATYIEQYGQELGLGDYDDRIHIPIPDSLAEALQ